MFFCILVNLFIVCFFCERGREGDSLFKGRKVILDEILEFTGRRYGEGDFVFFVMRYFLRLFYCVEWGLLFFIKVEGKYINERVFL